MNERLFMKSRIRKIPKLGVICIPRNTPGWKVSITEIGTTIRLRSRLTPTQDHLVFGIFRQYFRRKNKMKTVNSNIMSLKNPSIAGLSLDRNIPVTTSKIMVDRSM